VYGNAQEKDAELINCSRLKGLQLIMKDDFPDLIEIFFEDTKERFDNIKKKLSRTVLDCVSIKNDAHTLKGSSGNLFASELQQLFFKLEKMAHETRLEERGDLINQIEKEMKVVFQELSDFSEKQTFS
jgi:HPt (histidine-containing phosphotransfer) domain-containing protein